ncbi:anti-sigma factor family protein [Streptomyces sp. NPDC006704]|uniref:anti-sigma factor family protein n=1 Tax=Streptomyces sp. NPDC006704 TaxID=3364760 RepID=UPI0036776834
MTSTTGATEHPDVSEISELTEGVLPPRRTADVRRHLQDCALCADVRDSLEEIRDLLGTLPGPARMPADMAGRIDAALAAEALLNATAPERAPRETAHVSRETPVVVSTPVADPAASRPGAATAPADRPSGHARAATGPGRSKSRRRRGVLLTAVLGAAAIGAGIFFVQGIETGTTRPRAEQATSQASQPGGTTFSASSLEGRVQALLTSQGGQSTQKAPSAKIAPSQQNVPNTNENPSNSLRSAATVPPCVQAGTGRPSQQPLAVEQGTYEGTRAYLVVLPDQTDPANVQAYVIDASCENAGSSAPGKLLLTHSYPRG